MGSEAKEVVKFILMDCSDGHKGWYEKKLSKKKKNLEGKKTSLFNDYPEKNKNSL